MMAQISVRLAPLLFYKYYFPNQMINRTRWPIARKHSVIGDPNVRDNTTNAAVEIMLF